jgi:hypothetical protein
MEATMAEKRFVHVPGDQVGPMIAALRADGFTNVQQVPEDDGRFTLVGTNGDPGVADPGAAGAGQVDLSSIPAQDRAIAQKILDAFAAAGFGVFQQVAALANAIRESNLKPNAHSPPPEDSVGLFQLNRIAGLGRGHSAQSLEDPDTNIDIIIQEATKFPEFRGASSLDDAVAAFVRRVERPANMDTEIAKRQGIANGLMQQAPKGDGRFTLVGTNGETTDPGVAAPAPAGAGQVDLSSIPAQDRAIAQKILDSFAAAGFGVFQQVAALANAIRESNLKPNAHSPPPEDSVGLFQLNRIAGLGRGHSIQSLEDPDTNIDIIIQEATKFPEFRGASSLDDAVAAFVRRVERPANMGTEIAKRQEIANRLMQA